MDRISIGLFVNDKRDKDLQVTRRVLECLNRYGMTPLLTKPVAATLGLDGGLEEAEVFERSSFVISLGGDGTLLSAARAAYRYDVPVFGVNLGTVGFLAEVEINDIDNALQRLANRDYTLITRMVLSACVSRNDNCVYEGIALNDVVVSRGGLSRLIRLKVFVDNQFIDSFPGDGVIVSTPTGSTAYTLSAGGPIVQPDMRMMITSPICPHILYSRSFITSPDRTLTIRINDDYPDSAYVTLDGQEGFRAEAGDVITVKCMDKGVPFVSIYERNFYDVLRAKIHRGTE